MESKNIEEIQRQLDQALAITEGLKADLEVAKKAGRKKALAEIVESIDKSGLTIEEVTTAFANRNSRKAAKAESGANEKKPAKYQDPVSKKTWNGVGNPPRWLVGNKDDFLISNISKAHDA